MRRVVRSDIKCTCGTTRSISAGAVVEYRLQAEREAACFCKGPPGLVGPKRALGPAPGNHQENGMRTCTVQAVITNALDVSTIFCAPYAPV